MFKYNKLLGRIVEVGLTKEEFAKMIGISRYALYSKLKGKTDFTQKEIFNTMEVLKIPPNDISIYFFAQKV